MAEITDYLTIITVIVGGIWAIYKFGLTREKFSRLVINLEATVIKQIESFLLVSIVVRLENKGNTRISARRHKKIGDFLTDDCSDQCKHAGTLKIRCVPDNYRKELLFDWYSLKPSPKMFILKDGKSQEDDLEQINYLYEYEDLYLFSWDQIPGADENLIDFLIQKYNIDWIKTAKIEKSKDRKTIEVSTENTEKKSLLLKLNAEETKVNLEIDDGRTDEFAVRRIKGELNIYKHPEAQIIDVDFWLEPNEPCDLQVMVWLRPGTYAIKAYFLGDSTKYRDDEYWSTTRLFDLMVNKA